MKVSSRRKFYTVTYVTLSREVMCRAVDRGNSEKGKQDLRKIHGHTRPARLGSRR